MSKLLDALLGGATFEQALEGSSKELQRIAARKPSKFKTMNKNGYHTTELYRSIPPFIDDMKVSSKVLDKNDILKKIN